MPAGRKPKFESAEQMKEKIDAYFEECKGEPLMDDDGRRLYTKNGIPIIVNGRPPTVTGLALALGFTSRQALLLYQGKKEFNEIITEAKSRVEQYTEERLFDKDGANGAKFSLQNNFRGWRERPEEEEREQGGVVIINAVKESQ